MGSTNPGRWPFCWPQIGQVSNSWLSGACGFCCCARVEARDFVVNYKTVESILTRNRLRLIGWRWLRRWGWDRKSQNRPNPATYSSSGCFLIKPLRGLMMLIDFRCFIRFLICSNYFPLRLTNSELNQFFLREARNHDFWFGGLVFYDNLKPFL